MNAVNSAQLQVPTAADSTAATATTAVRVWRMSTPSLVMLVGLAALVYVAFADCINWLVRGWDEPEASHGALVPFVVAFLVWQQRDRLERLEFTGSWQGVIWVAVAAVLFTVGELSTVYTIEHYALVLSIAGLVLSLTGPKAFRLLYTPLLLLLFMIPLPTFFLFNLSLQMQLLSSHLGVFFMRLLGISVFVEGNVIDLGTYKLQVAEACDGLRYLFPLMTIGFIMAYFYRAPMWKRAIVFLSSIPLTIFMNSFRVAMIGVMVEYWGIGMAEGFLHEFQGWLLFMITAALMLGEIALLSAVSGDRSGWRRRFRIELPAPSPAGAQIVRRSIPITTIVAAAILLAQTVTSWALPERKEIVPARASLTGFPGGLLGREAIPGTLDAAYLQQLKLDDYLLSDYVAQSRPPVNLYIAYYGSQRKGDAVHSPRSCLPGGGWEVQQFGQRQIPGVFYEGEPVRVNRAVVQLGQQRSLVYYWFVQRGRIVTNEFAVKWYLFWDSITKRRTDGALVRLVTSLPRTGDESESDRDLSAFVGAVSRVLPEYVRN